MPSWFQTDKDGEWGFVGNEGAGIVQEAGENARHLIGKIVFFQGATYSTLTKRPMHDVQVQHEGVTPKEAASSFVNPITALGMLEKMRKEGHSAIVHTAAGSQLGMMLIRLCQAEKVPLVNIVRKQETVDQLKGLGAKYVVNSSAETFKEDLTRALAETGATIAFDAVGGGDLAGKILECMESAAWFRGDKGSHYGSSVWKQVYAYGRLDSGPTTIQMVPGYRWNYGGYLVSDFLETVPQDWLVEARARVANELKTTFRTEYGQEISLQDFLKPEMLKSMNEKRTNLKFLVV